MRKVQNNFQEIVKHFPYYGPGSFVNARHYMEVFLTQIDRMSTKNREASGMQPSVWYKESLPTALEESLVSTK